MLGSVGLDGFYKENFAMKMHGGFSLNEIDEMIVFEREIYMAQLIHHLREKAENTKG